MSDKVHGRRVTFRLRGTEAVKFDTLRLKGPKELTWTQLVLKALHFYTDHKLKTELESAVAKQVKKPAKPIRPRKKPSNVDKQLADYAKRMLPS